MRCLWLALLGGALCAACLSRCSADAASPLHTQILLSQELQREVEAGQASPHSVSHSRSASAVGSLKIWQTSQVTGDRLTRIADVPIVPAEHGRNLDADPRSIITLQKNDPLQPILGFGGAITEAAITVLGQMPDDKVQEVIDAYYGENGNRYSLGRLHINSCDFSVVGSWSFDNVTDDFDLKYFDRSLTHEQQYLIPFVRRVRKAQYHDIKLFASPWSPPAWMKGNNDMLGSSIPGLKEDPTGRDRYRRAWADYLALWVTSMKQQGIDMWGMTIQNEPEYAAPWEACVYTAEQERDFLNAHLGPVMREQHPDLKLIAFDHNKDHVYDWAKVLFGNKTSNNYLAGIGVHWYSGDAFENLLAVHRDFPEKMVFATEATHVNGIRFGSFERAEAYAHDILGDINAYAQGWTDWNIVLDTEGGPNHLGNFCDAPIIANTTSGELIYQPMYYYLGHFSRFLPPNKQSVRIGHVWRNWVTNLEMGTFLVKRESDSSARGSNAGGESAGVTIEDDEDAGATSESKSRRHERSSKSSRRHGKKESKRSKNHRSKEHSSKHLRRSASATQLAEQQNDEHDVVIVLMNPNNAPAQVILALGTPDAPLEATVRIPQHSIQTIVFDAHFTM